jgi:hypothetical protein
MSYPTSIDTFTNPQANDRLNSPAHHTVETNQNTAIRALEIKVGVNTSSVTSSIDYLLTNPASVDPGHLHTVDTISATGTQSSSTFLRGDGVWASNSKFGGTGSDGALNVTGGDVNIDLGNAAVVVKNYTVINITGSYKLTFSNPHTNGTVVILKSQTSVTLTSSATPMIDMRGIGAAAANNGSTEIGTGATAGGTGGNGTGSSSPGAGGTAGAAISPVYPTTYIYRNIYFSTGSGGGTGGTGQNASVGSPGSGGGGGGALIIECGGALNFTTASGISVAGVAGSNAVSETTGDRGGAGGGGGGAGGACLIMYNSLTANSGTITVSGGTAGSGGNAGSGHSATSGGGGGGGGANVSVGNAGVTGQTSGAGGNGGAGGSGSSGWSLVVANTVFF